MNGHGIPPCINPSTVTNPTFFASNANNLDFPTYYAYKPTIRTRSSFGIGTLTNKETIMGWGRYFFLGDLGQQFDLEDQKSEIENLRIEMSQNRYSSQNVEQAFEHLQAENDELRLYLTAIVRLLISKGVVTNDEMRRVVDAIDAEDGTRDGKYKGRVE
jgi:hypothetical protein